MHSTHSPNRVPARPARVVATLALLAALAPSAAQAQAQAETKSERKGPRHDTTEVIGSAPDDLVGRWIFVVQASPTLGIKPTAPAGADGEGRIGGDASQTGSGVSPMARTLEIRKIDGKLDVTVHHEQVSPEVRDKLLPPAGAKAPQEFPPPDPALLARVSEQWETLEAARGEQSAIASKLLDYSAASEEDKAKAGGGSFDLALVTTEQYPGGKSLQLFTSTYAIEKMEPGSLKGRYLGAMVLPGRMSGSMAFPPIPVGLEGTFRAYRVEEPEPPSILSRILGWFAGCGG